MICSISIETLCICWDFFEYFRFYNRVFPIQFTLRLKRSRPTNGQDKRMANFKVNGHRFNLAIRRFGFFHFHSLGITNDQIRSVLYKGLRQFKFWLRACYQLGLGSVLNQDQGQFQIKARANSLLGEGPFRIDIIVASKLS